MKRYSVLLLLLGLFSLVVVATADDPQPTPADVRFHGTMKQIIGTFSTYGHVRVGDVLDLDFAKLPSGKIELMRPNFDPNRDVSPYIPIQNPLVVTKINIGKPDVGGILIVLTSTDKTGKLVLQLRAPELKPGTPATLYLYEESFDWIGCMASAEGVLQ